MLSPVDTDALFMEAKWPHRTSSDDFWCTASSEL
jgi:hypothetical protein